MARKYQLPFLLSVLAIIILAMVYVKDLENSNSELNQKLDVTSIQIKQKVEEPKIVEDSMLLESVRRDTITLQHYYNFLKNLETP